MTEEKRLEGERRGLLMRIKRSDDRKKGPGSTGPRKRSVKKIANGNAGRDKHITYEHLTSVMHRIDNWKTNLQALVQQKNDAQLDRKKRKGRELYGELLTIQEALKVGKVGKRKTASSISHLNSYDNNWHTHFKMDKKKQAT